MGYLSSFLAKKHDIASYNTLIVLIYWNFRDFSCAVVGLTVTGDTALCRSSPPCGGEGYGQGCLSR